jgi:hypothetical protein
VKLQIPLKSQELNTEAAIMLSFLTALSVCIFQDDRGKHRECPEKSHIFWSRCDTCYVFSLIIVKNWSQGPTTTRDLLTEEKQICLISI